jgi:hypothetical protein
VVVLELLAKETQEVAETEVHEAVAVVEQVLLVEQVQVEVVLHGLSMAEHMLAVVAHLTEDLVIQGVRVVAVQEHSLVQLLGQTELAVAEEVLQELQHQEVLALLLSDIAIQLN